MLFQRATLFFLCLLFVGPYLGIAVPLAGLVLGAAFIIGAAIVGNWGRSFCGMGSAIQGMLHEPLFWLAAITLVSFGLSSALGIDPGEALGKWGDVIGIAVAGTVWYFGLRSLDRSFAEKFPLWILLALTLTSALYLSEALLWKFTGVSFHSERFFLTMRKLGSIYAIVMPFAMLYVLRSDKLWSWAALLLCSVTVFFCGGRSGAVAYTCMVLLFGYFFPWGSVASWGRGLFKYAVVHLTGAAIGIYGYFLMIGKDEFVSRIASERASTGSGRSDIWKFSWENFLDHPLLGIGIRGFRSLDFSDVRLSSTFHPHNIVLELLLEVGLIGTLLLAAFVIGVLKKTVWVAHRKEMTDPYAIRPLLTACMIAIVSYCIAGQFMTSFFHGWWLSYPTILIALTGALYHIYMKENLGFQLESAGKAYPVTVSVVMPCHNGAKYIGQAIESVQAQSFRDWELLVVNDGSKDESQEIIERYAAQDSRIKPIVHTTARGAGGARNTGLENVTGRYVAFLDCDDLWKPEKLELQLSAMKQSGAALSATYYDVIDGSDHVMGSVTPTDHIFTFGRLLKCNDIGCSSAMIDRAYVGDLRFPDYQRAQDFVFWCEILRRGYLCLCLHKNLGAYRVHSKSRTLNKIETAKNRINLLHKAIGVPLLIMPYYIVLYVIYGILKQMRSQSNA